MIGGVLLPALVVSLGHADAPQAPPPSPDPGQRAMAIRQVAEQPSGAMLTETPQGVILVACATVPVAQDAREDRAFAGAAAAALIEARAEAALYLEGVYQTSSESGTSAEVASDGSARKDAWVRTNVSSMARAKLVGGVPLEIVRTGTGVRAVVVWGLASAASDAPRCDAAGLAALSEASIAAREVPACDLRWVKDAEGREGLLIVIAIHPDGEPGECVRARQGGMPCSCHACRDRVLDILLQRTVAGWGTEGDVGVARTLTRVSTRTTIRAREGTAAVKTVSRRSLGSRTQASLGALIPPDYFASVVREHRHARGRSVCAAFVPSGTAPAPGTGAATPSPGAVRGMADDIAPFMDGEVRPGSGGSFPWPAAPVLPALYDPALPLPSPGGTFGRIPAGRTQSP